MPSTLRAVIFDLGGTLVHFPAWDESAAEKWAASYDSLSALGLATPDRDAYVQAMREAERPDAVIGALAEVPPLVTGWSR